MRVLLLCFLPAVGIIFSHALPTINSIVETKQDRDLMVSALLAGGAR